MGITEMWSLFFSIGIIRMKTIEVEPGLRVGLTATLESHYFVGNAEPARGTIIVNGWWIRGRSGQQHGRPTLVAVGVAFLNPIDEPNDRAGLHLAVNRAVDDLGEQMFVNITPAVRAQFHALVEDELRRK
jgi:hypothetical protein